jgi:ppGpp synthetase/RelA/SpoT-type nucleotidyltranferase
MMPTPDAHTAKLRAPDPNRYIRFRRGDEPSDVGADVTVLWGVLREPEGETKVEPVTLFLDAEAMSADQARDWLQDHDFDPTTFVPAPRENPDASDPVLKALDAQHELIRENSRCRYKDRGGVEIETVRDNPKTFVMDRYGREDYPGIFGDPDRDDIPTADDPHPTTPGDTESVEEVRLADELEELIEAREDYGDVTAAVHDRLQELVPARGKTKARVKTPYSIINKLRRKRLDTLTDIAGTMAVVPDKEALEDLVETITGGALGTVLEHENHYEGPGPYRAHHFIIEREGRPVEVQVKTVRQFLLSKAAHKPYKTGRIDTAAMERIAALAAKADAGDEAAAAKVQPLLKDQDALEERLTETPEEAVTGDADERKNPHARSELRRGLAWAATIGLALGLGTAMNRTNP